MTYLDFDYDSDAWIEIPVQFGPEWTWETPADWARELAEIIYDLIVPLPGDPGPDHLALTLALCAERLPRPPGRRAFLWMPDPAGDFVAVMADRYRAEGDRDESLRDLARPRDVETVEPPVLEPFSTAELGPGVKSVSYFVDHEDDVVLSAHYAFRVREIDLDVWAVVYDIALGLQALPEIEALLHRVRVFDQVPDDDED